MDTEIVMPDTCPQRAAAQAKEHEHDRGWREWMQQLYRKAARTPGELTCEERLALRETDAQLRLSDYSDSDGTPAVEFRGENA